MRPGIASYLKMSALTLATLAAVACSEVEPTPIPTPLDEPVESVVTPEPELFTPTPLSTRSPAATLAQPTSTSEPEPAAPTVAPDPTQELETDEVIYSDDFQDISSGWPNEFVFDNYYIGYHEPSFYHVEIHEPNDSAIVALPDQTFDDITIEAEIFVSEANSSPNGDFRYGLVIRRSGNEYYAFTVSPRSKNWQVFKSSPTGQEVLQEGIDESILGLEDSPDLIRVDANGSSLTFHINGQPVSFVNDTDYTSGDVGFFVETFDSPRAHIHFDSLSIGEVREVDVLYDDNFQDIFSGWPNELVFDNYYIGYHEPDFYHVEIHEPNDSAVVVLQDQSFDDVTTEAEIFVSEANSSQSGDFRYGLALRRSGKQFYAFTVSPRSKRWSVLKSSPNGILVLQEGTDESIQGLEDSPDSLRIDAIGSALTFHINGQPVSYINDTDYTSGDVGFYVETLDSVRAHIHYDSLTIREPRSPQPICTVIANALHLRSGPSISFAPPISILLAGSDLEPLSRSSDGRWIQVRVLEEGQSGWVSASEQYISCNFTLSDLPVS